MAAPRPTGPGPAEPTPAGLDPAAADPDRTLTLLWRHVVPVPGGSRGPEQRTSVDEVVRTAVTVADEEGLGALSMRKVAERLGLKVMSLYTYVRSRDELVALMLDQVAAEQPLPALAPTLRARLRQIAELTWDECRRHPWLLLVQTSRPVPGPHVSDRYEWQLSALEGCGFSDVDMDQIVTLLTGFATGAARSLVDAEQVRVRSGLSDAEWWEINGPILGRLMPAERYPVSGRVGTAAGQTYDAASDPIRSFEFGLERVLDGIEVYTEQVRGR